MMMMITGGDGGGSGGLVRDWYRMDVPFVSVAPRFLQVILSRRLAGSRDHPDLTGLAQDIVLSDTHTTPQCRESNWNKTKLTAKVKAILLLNNGSACCWVPSTYWVLARVMGDGCCWVVGVVDTKAPILMYIMLSDGSGWSELINGIKFDHPLWIQSSVEW